MGQGCCRGGSGGVYEGHRVALAHVREGVSQGQCDWEEGGHRGCAGEWRSLKGYVVRSYR